MLDDNTFVSFLLGSLTCIRQTFIETVFKGMCLVVRQVVRKQCDCLTNHQCTDLLSVGSTNKRPAAWRTLYESSSAELCSSARVWSISWTIESSHVMWKTSSSTKRDRRGEWVEVVTQIRMKNSTYQSVPRSKELVLQQQLPAWQCPVN